MIGCIIDSGPPAWPVTMASSALRCPGFAVASTTAAAVQSPWLITRAALMMKMKLRSPSCTAPK
jgi:hypothetical protein